MTDRELLESAAKAAGLTIGAWSDNYGAFMYRGVEPGKSWWNPLTDDGDALRLAVKLGMAIIQINDRETRSAWIDANGLLHTETAEDDYAATRRAIVKAAAEIGKQT